MFFLKPESASPAAATDGTLARLVMEPDRQPKCAICWEDLLPVDLLGDKITTQCEHATIACINCLRQSIAAQLDRGWDKITCPICSVPLDSIVVERYGSAETIDR